MNLESLIEGIEKSAAQVKSVAEGTIEKPLVSAELDKLLTKEAAAESAKAAFEDGQNLAQAILEKLAQEAVTLVSTEQTEALVEGTEKTAEAAPVVAVEATEEATETQEDNMNKQATEAGAKLAEQIIKEANRIIAETSGLVAQHDQRIGPTPGVNGTVNNLFDAIVAKAKSMGPVGVDQASGAAPSSTAEGRDPAMGTPSIPPSPDVVVKTAEEEMQEKQAAVNALVEAGMDWDTAVDLVKAAAEEIEQEEFGQVKVAAVGQLVSEGYDFDSAVAAVQAATSPEAG